MAGQHEAGVWLGVMEVVYPGRVGLRTLSLQCLGSSTESHDGSVVSDDVSDGRSRVTTSTSSRTGGHTSSHAPTSPGGGVSGPAPHKQSSRSLVMERMRRNMGGQSGGPLALLGVESSCDDTGVAVVDERGRVLGEAIHSQLMDHQKWVESL